MLMWRTTKYSPWRVFYLVYLMFFLYVRIMLMRAQCLVRLFLRGMGAALHA